MHKSKQMVESYVFFREEQRKAEIEKKTQPKKTLKWHNCYVYSVYLLFFNTHIMQHSNTIK